MDGAPLLISASLFAVDGDSIKCDGMNMRLLGNGIPFVSGIDALEIRGTRCEQDRFRRPLIRAMNSDGETVGSILIEERLAFAWRPDHQIDWCPTLGHPRF